MDQTETTCELCGGPWDDCRRLGAPVCSVCHQLCPGRLGLRDFDEAVFALSPSAVARPSP